MQMSKAVESKHLRRTLKPEGEALKLFKEGKWIYLMLNPYSGTTTLPP